MVKKTKTKNTRSKSRQAYDFRNWRPEEFDPIIDQLASAHLPRQTIRHDIQNAVQGFRLLNRWYFKSSSTAEQIKTWGKLRKTAAGLLHLLANIDRHSIGEALPVSASDFLGSSDRDTKYIIRDEAAAVGKAATLTKYRNDFSEVLPSIFDDPIVAEKLLYMVKLCRSNPDNLRQNLRDLVDDLDEILNHRELGAFHDAIGGTRGGEIHRLFVGRLAAIYEESTHKPATSSGSRSDNSSAFLRFAHAIYDVALGKNVRRFHQLKGDFQRLPKNPQTDKK